MKKAPTAIIMRLGIVALEKPVYVRNSLKLAMMNSVNDIVFYLFTILLFCLYPMVTSVVPSITESPTFTRTDVTVPSFSASMLFCIFMASRMTTVSPA